jgi:DNA-binding LacI/PurR family transcriptional regulator
VKESVSTRRVTSKDVARRAGVSRTTVSLVLNKVEGAQISQETRQKVVEAANDLGYVPEAAAQALASRRSQFIGLILTRNPHHVAADAFLTQIIHSLIKNVRGSGMRLLLDIIEETHPRETYLDLARGRHIDGILISGPRFDDEALMALKEIGFPTVLMGEIPGEDFYSVDVDNRGAARTAVEHLIQLGHTRIACITNAPTSYTAAYERLSGYREALEQNGLAFDKRLVGYGDFDPQSGLNCMNSLLNLEPPLSAVFVASDVVAIGAMKAIRDHDLKIPEDIALAGFDDVSFSRYILPPLTTIRLPAVELAYQASEMLIQLINGEEPPRKKVCLGTDLIIRASSGPAV